MKSVGIELPDVKVIKSLQEGESYKYLGILEADKFLEEKMKLNVLTRKNDKKFFEVKTEWWEFSSWS